MHERNCVNVTSLTPDDEKGTSSEAACKTLFVLTLSVILSAIAVILVQ
jgi:hypothetical protein